MAAKANDRKTGAKLVQDDLKYWTKPNLISLTKKAGTMEVAEMAIFIIKGFPGFEI